VRFKAALAAVQAGANDADGFDQLARAALADGEEQSALTALEPAAKRSSDPRLWQWVGLLRRSLDDLEASLAALAKAAELAPTDESIAHSHARVALEAGLDAIGLFRRAQLLAPADGAVLLGLAAARNAVGEGEAAADQLLDLLDRAPAWIAGHEQLAQLRSTLGHRVRSNESLERALVKFPRQPALWTALLAMHVRAGDYAGLRREVGRAASAGIPAVSLAVYRAIAASELDEDTHPAPLFGQETAALADALGIWRVRHLLRVGAVDAALSVLDVALKGDPSSELWAYAATAWRMADDPRSAWLEGIPGIVAVSDLTESLPPIDQLAATLRSLHSAKAEYLDQSVRGGTQTDGPLFSRIDPVIRGLRAAIVDAVTDYVAQLPPPDPRHPLLARRRDRQVRFSGSWSVRLRSGGRHSNHVHPQGWISSALYIALPPRTVGDAKDAGWLTLGEPDDKLGLPLEPWRKIEPKTAHLALFPSWMWHGTVPFADGERLTVAFDVRPPI
jgi:tetratricopeptide (TPR) repeat protein